MVNPLGIEPRT